MLSIESIRYLCFGIGGVNGWAYIGVLEALETEFQKNNLVLYSQLKGIAGSSIGSIISVALILQYNAIELREFFSSISTRFKDAFTQKNVLNLFDRKGIMEITGITEIIQTIIVTKLGQANRDITLAALYERTHKVLAIGTQNITMERAEILDHQSMPNLPVWKAVCMSCAIPFIFHPVEQNNCLYVDAGMSEPVPYTVFPLAETLVCYIHGHHGYAPAQSIGMMDFLCRVLHGVEQATHIRMDSMPQEYKLRFLKLRLPCSSSSADGFSLNDKMRDQLMEIGRTTTLSLFHYKNALLTQALLASAHINKFKPKSAGVNDGGTSSAITAVGSNAGAM